MYNAHNITFHGLNNDDVSAIVEHLRSRGYKDSEDFFVGFVSFVASNPEVAIEICNVLTGRVGR